LAGTATDALNDFRSIGPSVADAGSTLPAAASANATSILLERGWQFVTRTRTDAVAPAQTKLLTSPRGRGSQQAGGISQQLRLTSCIACIAGFIDMNNLANSPSDAK